MIVIVKIVMIIKMILMIIIITINNYYKISLTFFFKSRYLHKNGVASFSIRSAHKIPNLQLKRKPVEELESIKWQNNKNS